MPSEIKSEFTKVLINNFLSVLALLILRYCSHNASQEIRCLYNQPFCGSSFSSQYCPAELDRV